jgi:hypothetical protein
MGLERVLLPAEKVVYVAPGPFFVDGNDYTPVVTNRRFLLYAERGWFGRRIDVRDHAFKDMAGASYQEHGMFPKQGDLILEMLHGEPFVYNGPAEVMRPMYRAVAEARSNPS